MQTGFLIVTSNKHSGRKITQQNGFCFPFKLLIVVVLPMFTAWQTDFSPLLDGLIIAEHSWLYLSLDAIFKIMIAIKVKHTLK